MSDIHVIEAIHAPCGAAKKGGGLHTMAPTELLAGSLRALQQRAGLDTEAVGRARATVSDGIPSI